MSDLNGSQNGFSSLAGRIAAGTLNETEDAFCTRREREELLLAISSSNSIARDVHYALANGYRVRLDALTRSRQG